MERSKLDDKEGGAIDDIHGNTHTRKTQTRNPGPSDYMTQYCRKEPHTSIVVAKIRAMNEEESGIHIELHTAKS